MMPGDEIICSLVLARGCYGVGHHTKDDCRPEDAFMQVYRPLYETAYAYRNGGMFDLRPLYMFYKPAIVNGVEVPRFTKITDPEVIARLGTIKARMYPDGFVTATMTSAH